jgi:hypothetical protein
MVIDTTLGYILIDPNKVVLVTNKPKAIEQMKDAGLIDWSDEDADYEKQCVVAFGDKPSEIVDSAFLVNQTAASLALRLQELFLHERGI